MKKLLSILLASTMMLGLFACGSPSGSSAEKSKLVVGTSADYAPYEFHKLVDGKDEILGFDMDLAREIANDMGKELVIKDMDFKLLLSELNLGNIDMIIAGFSPDPERDVSYSDVYYKASQTVLTLKDSALDSFELLAGKQVGVQTGSLQEKIITTDAPNAKLVSLAKIPNLIAELKGGKIDALVIEKPVADGYIANHPDLEIAFDIHTSDSGSAVAVKKGNEALLEHINKTIKNVSESGQMDEFVANATIQSQD